MPIKAILDTNVWVSSLLNPGTARQLVQALKGKHFELYVSVQLMAELINIVNRPKIKVFVEENDVNDLLVLIQDRATP